MATVKEFEDKLRYLSNLKKELDKYRPLTDDEQAILDRDAKIEHVWSSNAIEGSTLNRAETEAVINTGLTIGGLPLAEVLAAKDLSEAYDFMMEMASKKQKLTARDIKGLNWLAISANHRDWAGQYRNVEVRPAGSDFNPYSLPWNIDQEMDNLIDWANANMEKLHPVQYAAELHLKFVTIHPFRDGNGRTARLLMNFALAEHGYPVINIQPDQESRNQYIDILLKCQKEKSSQDFVSLLADYSIKELKRRIRILQVNEKHLDDSKKDDIARDMQKWLNERNKEK